MDPLLDVQRPGRSWAAIPELGRDGRFRLVVILLSAICGDSWLGIKAAWRRNCYIWLDCSSNVGIYIRQKKGREEENI